MNSHTHQQYRILDSSYHEEEPNSVIQAFAVVWLTIIEVNRVCPVLDTAL